VPTAFAALALVVVSLIVLVAARWLCRVDFDLGSSNHT
jgi:hypothetical protein